MEKVNWYPYLIPKEGRADKYLLNHVKPLHQLLICFINPKGDRFFTSFGSVVEFIQYESTIDPPQRCFHEVITDFPAKMYFDLDFPANVKDSDYLDVLIDKLVLKFQHHYGIALNLERDLLVFTSHRPDKKSYHLIVDNYTLHDHVERQLFCKSVCDSLNNPHIDQGVYTSIHQLRMEGSTKEGKNSPKTLETKWFYHGKTIIYKYKHEICTDFERRTLTLEAGCVTIIGNCNFLTRKFTPPIIVVHHDEVNVTLEQASTCLTKLANFAGIATHELPYKFERVVGPFIILKRLFPSHCRLCDRVHEHIDPFLTLRRDNNYLYLNFHCRRAQKSILIDRWFEPEFNSNQQGNSTPQSLSVRAKCRHLATERT